MADQLTFEARLQDAFDRYLAAAPTALSASALAAVMAGERTPERGARRLGTSWLPRLSLRVLIVAAAVVLVAALLVAAAGALRLRTTENPQPPQPKPTLAAGAPAWEAIYLRSDVSGAPLVHVIEVRPDGTERLLRTLGTTVPGSPFALSAFGSVSEDGWLAVTTTSSGQLPIASWELLDLAHPARPPSIVRYPPVIDGRWSSTDLFATSSATGCSDPTCWQWIDIVDPRSGSTTGLGKISLFGGGPSIVWARDGSGILDGGAIRPVNGGNDVNIDPDQLFADRRLGKGGRTVDICRPTDQSRECPDAKGTAIPVWDLGRHKTAWYTSADPNSEPVEVVFSRDGQSLIVLLDRVQASLHTAVVARLDAPNTLTELASFQLPNGAFAPALGEIDPQDASFAISYSTGATDNPISVPGPILHADGSTSVAPPGYFSGYVSGSLAESWPAEGAFEPPASAP